MSVIVAAPTPRGPLYSRHVRAAAHFNLVNGWPVVMRFPPRDPQPGSNMLIDLSHWSAWELGGKETGRGVQELGGVDLPVRSIRPLSSGYICRLTPSRAMLFGPIPGPTWGAIDVTGGWATVCLAGPDREKILSKVTAIDLRDSMLPALDCCQGPIFGVNTLFCRFPDRFELHVCPDSLEFLWEVLLDGGAEFGLQPAGLDSYHRLRGTSE